MTERSEFPPGPRKIGARDGTTINLGSLGVRFMIYDVDSGGGFSLVEHPIPPRHLAAPLHRHSREDEYSYVIEGRLGALLGDDEVYIDAPSASPHSSRSSVGVVMKACAADGGPNFVMVIVPAGADERPSLR